MPLVSVVLPAYFSHDTISLSLDALRRQGFRDFEVIVVNSSPETKTGELVTARYPEVLFFQSPVRLYPHAARNYGIARAQGELLVCSDPDVAAHEDWLEKLVAAYRSGIHAGGGAMGVLEKTWWERGVHLAKFHELLPGLAAGERQIVPTANAFYSRDLWNRIGPFPENVFAGDAIMSWRASQAGHPPRFLPDAQVDHVHGGGWRQLWKERTTRGREFLRERAKFEEWSPGRALSYLVFTPLLPALVQARTFRAASQTGWLAPYFATLPIQLWAQAGWTLGEARAALQLFRRESP
jgi:GT2 family glycosyltransferase